MAPEDSGRSGAPGNQVGMKPIHIKTSKPGMLIGNSGNLSQGKVFSGKVPGRAKGKAYAKSKGMKSRSY